MLLSVHHLPRPHHFAAEGLADALMAKADTEQRQLAGEALDNGQRDAGLVGGAGTGGKDDALGRYANRITRLSPHPFPGALAEEGGVDRRHYACGKRGTQGDVTGQAGEEEVRRASANGRMP